MIKHKISLENISQNFGSSFTVKKFEGSTKNADPKWHFHPEIELVFVKGGNGKRHIGNHLSYFRNGDLILLGPNLPHLGFTDRLTGNETETVIQFSRDFLGKKFFDSPEMVSIREMFDRSVRGVLFGESVKHKIGHRIESLTLFPAMPRLISFLRILKDLSISQDFQLLNVEEYQVKGSHESNDRIKAIYQFVNTNFKQVVSLDEISNYSNMTKPAFCRYFKKQTGKTFTHFLNEFRIIHACKLLSESSMQVNQIALESGFNNMAYFNKQFVRITGKTPSDYRKDFKGLIK